MGGKEVVVVMGCAGFHRAMVGILVAEITGRGKLLVRPRSLFSTVDAWWVFVPCLMIAKFFLVVGRCLPPYITRYAGGIKKAPLLVEHPADLFRELINRQTI